LVGGLVPIRPVEGAPAHCSANGYGRHEWGVLRKAKTKVSGSQANIEVRRADLCDPPDDGVGVGVAGVVTLQPPGAESSDRFARAGWQRVRYPDGSLGPRAAFADWFHDGSADFVLMWELSLGDVSKYKVSWKNNEDGKIHFFFCNADGTNCQEPPTREGGVFTTPFNPGLVWSDIHGYVAAWTTHVGVDLSGTVEDKANYRQIMFRQGTGGWQTYATTACRLPPDLTGCRDSVERYHMVKVDDSHMRTWTDSL
jgi:hypothetical protein